MAETQLAIVTLEQATELKKFGFNWPVYEHYSGENISDSDLGWKLHDWNSLPNATSAPTVSHALMWLRSNNIIIWPCYSAYDCNGKEYGVLYLSRNGEVAKLGSEINRNCEITYDTFEKAESKALEHGLKMLKKAMEVSV